jgi:hypothetical protein
MSRHVFFTLLFLTVSQPGYGQLSWSDNFSNGNFTTNPEWIGDTSDFIVNADKRLQLSNNVAGQSYLVTASQVAQNAIWEFFIRMDFNPSASNFATIHLMMDVPNPSQAHNGYFLRFGGTTERRIHLFRRDGTQQTQIAVSAINMVNSAEVVFNIRVTRNAQGVFELLADSAMLGNFQPLFQVLDTTHKESFWFGVQCNYTVTRADKFFFDNFNVSGQGFIDTVAPVLQRAEVIDSSLILMRFSKPIANADKQRFLLFPGSQNPDSVWASSNELFLKLHPPLTPAIQHQMAITGLEDSRGNRMRDTMVTLLYFRASHQSVVFNEIMADPDPPVKLPNAEYLELYNRTNFPINLSNWTLDIGNTTRVFGPTTSIPPLSYLIVTRHQDTAQFLSYGLVAGLSISATALANAGQELVLRNADGIEIDRVAYSDTWYRDPTKRQGGWSLERIDTDRLCGDVDNWIASTAKEGGTPGKRNSTARKNPDKTAPHILASELPSPGLVRLQFNESLAASAADKAHFEWLENVVTDSVWFEEANRRAVVLQLRYPLSPGKKYKLAVSRSLTDCTGNRIVPDTLRFGLPEFPEVGDVIINEVLFNPPTGGVRFIELFNTGNKVINMSQLRLGQYQNEQAASDFRQAVAPHILLFPGEYVVFTTDVQQLLKQHPQAAGKQAQVANLPSMTVSGGSLALANASLELLDWLVFDNSMHHPMLRESRGVSLERIRPGGSPNDPSNWTSAAAQASFATPGAKNSNYSDPAVSGRKFTLEDNPFYPNGDGFRDRIRILYELEQGGFIAHMRVFDLNGREIAHPVNQVSLATRGEVAWQGEMAGGKVAPPGIYVLMLEVLHPSGAAYTFKTACTLGVRR